MEIGAEAIAPILAENFEIASHQGIHRSHSQGVHPLNQARGDGGRQFD